MNQYDYILDAVHADQDYTILLTGAGQLVKVLPYTNVNLIPDSNIVLGTQYWHQNPTMVVTPGAGAVAGNAWVFTSTAAGNVGYNFVYSALITVFPVKPIP